MTEIEKFENCAKERRLLEDFLLFAARRRINLGKTSIDEEQGRVYHDMVSEIDLINEFLGIDPDKLDEELTELTKKQGGDKSDGQTC